MRDVELSVVLKMGKTDARDAASAKTLINNVNTGSKQKRKPEGFL